MTWPIITGQQCSHLLFSFDFNSNFLFFLFLIYWIIYSYQNYENTSNCSSQLRAPAPNPLCRWYAGKLPSKQTEQSTHETFRFFIKIIYIKTISLTFDRRRNLQAPRAEAVEFGTRVMFTRSRLSSAEWMSDGAQVSRTSTTTISTPLFNFFFAAIVSIKRLFF